MDLTHVDLSFASIVLSPIPLIGKVNFAKGFEVANSASRLQI